ncbi:MAG: hypothetical protein IJA89_07170 [Clostridia bacterium]|nr:hypothetical protein [Clostridia bacterium]
MKAYLAEIDGQREFYSRIGINPDLSHNTDGVDRGNLYENKLNIDNINKVLFQAIKYASRIRIRGEKLPANIILNDLNREIVYIFQSADLLADIEKVYFGAASKGNDEFTTTAKHIEIDYSSSSGLMQLLQFVNSDNFVKYHIDKFNIIGLSQQYYKLNPDKDSFVKGENAEIRKPVVLQDRIYPYEKANNLEFEDIMDCLNPGLLQREQGAYYTPKAYVEEMHKLLYKAISEVPEGMDYIIIDRCAGTGNLEEGLPDEILKHCILSTIEFNEYVILNLKYGDKCLVVIPNTDALAYDIIPAEHNEQGIANDYIREKVNDNNCVVILMENPPYSEAGSGGTQSTGKKENAWKQSYVMQKMRNEYKGAVLNDLSNLFIWSGFKYYLKKPCDGYILYSPTKYWRNQGLVNKKFCGGFFCNRQEFHASQCSAIGCIYWSNIDDYETATLTLTPYDIVGDKVVRSYDDITIKKAYKYLSSFYDNRTFENDQVNGVLCESNGAEFVDNGRNVRIKPIYNENIIAYLKADSMAIDRKHISLTRCGYFKGDGFFVRVDNYIEKLPLFIASVFPYDKWYKTDVYSKSYDGQGNYIKDREFLKRCLLYTALTPKNKCRSLVGSDKRFYRNELCFDKEDTLAYNSLQEFINDGYELLEIEENLLKYWSDVIFEIKRTEEYKKALKQCPDFRFGLWQIMEEINIKIDSGRKNRQGEPIFVYKYANLNTAIKTLDTTIKTYYEEYIIPLLFKYELVK